MERRSLKFINLTIFSFLILPAMPFSYGYTNEEDVYAINSLYLALDSPPIPGWTANGGDPCAENWQGVLCVGSNITSIILNAANLGGQLGDNLNNFTSIITIDLSNNNIGGSIPENLPTSMSKFFLSANMFTGSIPSSLSKLTLLSDMSLNENHLTGELPDAFQFLTSLINLDMSTNNLSGPLPPSMANLSSLTTFHVQSNLLTGTLDVLQDLPIKNLNIENNQFAGPIPQKILNIPIFLKDGNPFNILTTPPMPAPPPLPISRSPAPVKAPTNSPGLSTTSSGSPINSPGPSTNSSGSSTNSRSFPSFSGGQFTSNTSSTGDKKKASTTLKVVGLVIVAVITLIVILLAIIFCMSKYQEKKLEYEIYGRQDENVQTRPKEPRIYQDTIQKQEENAKRQVDVAKSKEPKSKENLNKSITTEKVSKEKAHNIDITGQGIPAMQNIPEKANVKPRIPSEKIIQRVPENITNVAEKDAAGRTGFNQDIPGSRMDVNPPTPVTSFSVAFLQQHTNGFREENVILDSRVGKVYLAEILKEKRLMAVLKLDITNSRIPVDRFLELVLSVSELRHPRVTRLIGYCAEYEQRILVYDYFSNRTLHDVLHRGDDLKRRLSWNARIKVALEAAQALEYLHEKCQPPVIHKNFEPSSVLLNDKLTVCVSDCGLASLIPTHSVAQLSGRIRSLFSYEAPEVGEGGAYTEQSDVYSFGVVMLELLTGRIPYDSTRPRAEQHLTRWASSQLHDINALSRMVDPSMAGKYPIKSLSRFADLISGCIQRGPEFRPPMSQVVQDLSRVQEEDRAQST